MELGERLRNARLEAGLSQRQLCGETITRNMLSQIEHGTARPSMATLSCLAARLGKPVSFFLDEAPAASPNQKTMGQARERYLAGDFFGAASALAEYRRPDPVFDGEAGLLLVLSRMALAERAIEEHRLPYAGELLAQAAVDGTGCPYYTRELEQRRLLLLAKAQPERAAEIASALPGMDEALLLCAQGALAAGDPGRCARLLDAVENRDSRWGYFRGEAHLALGEYAQAIPCYQLAEDRDHRAVERLERCYRELEDYKMAYYYACKGR